MEEKESWVESFDKMLNKGSGGIIKLEENDILKSGWVKYQTKFSKRYRDVYAVLSYRFLYFFEKELYLDPIETIEIKQIKTVKSEEQSPDNRVVSLILLFIIFY